MCIRDRCIRARLQPCRRVTVKNRALAPGLGYLARKRVAGAKALGCLHFAARLKPCPDTQLIISPRARECRSSMPAPAPLKLTPLAAGAWCSAAKKCRDDFRHSRLDSPRHGGFIYFRNDVISLTLLAAGYEAFDVGQLGRVVAGVAGVAVFVLFVVVHRFAQRPDG